MKFDLSAEESLDKGIAAHSAGQLQEAEECYRDALNKAAQHPDALNLLGLLHYQTGRFPEAIELIQRAVDVDPEAQEFPFNLGEALNANGKHRAAVSAYERAVELDSKNGRALRSLGAVRLRLGETAAALTCFQRAVEINPGDLESKFNIAVVFLRLRRPSDAVKTLEELLALDPKFAAAYTPLCKLYINLKQIDSATATARLGASNRADADSYAFLAATLLITDSFDEAMQAAHQAVKLDPNCAEAHFQLGRVFDAMGEKRGAALAFGRAVELQPDFDSPHINLGLAQLALGDIARAAETLAAGAHLHGKSFECWFNLAIAYERLGKPAEAIKAIEKALELKPDSATSYVVFATLEAKRGNHSAAAPLFERAVELKPTLGSAWSQYASFYADRGDPCMAVDVLRRFIAQGQKDTKASSVFCFFTNVDPRLSPSEIYDEHRRCAATLYDDVKVSPALSFPNDRDPKRRLRIGYVSPDLRGHSVSFFISTLLRAHDRSAVEVFCYDDSCKPDSVTSQLQARTDRWRRTTDVSNDRLIEFVREDQIDILVDLSGHTADNRMPAFARRAAPIQVTYLGYPNTTGLKTMDYRLTDALADPPGMTDLFHTEKLIRLPGTFLCYGSTPDAPAVANLPADKNGYVTFASFNALPKVNLAVIELWTRIVNAVPDSRLFLKGVGLSDESTCNLFRERFERFGLASERLEFAEKTSLFQEHMALYGRCDIGLDPFPYNGTTTTCEALWMGTPVVTLEGDSHVSRVGVSIMTNMGMADWIAKTPDQYVEIAKAKATDLDALRQTRGQLRDVMNASPLRDREQFAKNVETAYRQMWVDWCAVRQDQ